MKNNKKVNKIIKLIIAIGISIMIIQVIAISFMVIFKFFGRTSLWFNEKKIIGKNVEEIEELYGEPDFSKDSRWIGYKLQSRGIDSAGVFDKCYCIFIDSNGCAEKVGLYELTDVGVNFDNELEENILSVLGNGITMIFISILSLVKEIIV